MTKSVTPTPGLLQHRAAVAASPEWRNLLNHFELDPEGFAFIVLLVPDGEWAGTCRGALSRFLLASHTRRTRALSRRWRFTVESVMFWVRPTASSALAT
jgi:hypothetical protein